MTGVDGASPPPAVLVVGADADARESIARRLAADLCVRATGSADEAMASMRRSRPDVIVCDLILPGTSGEAFVERVRSEPRFEVTPLIVVTSVHDDQVRLRLLENGADDVLEQPLRLAELDIRVHNLVSRARCCAELQARNAELSLLTDQLQRALQSRVVIEQAKAFVAAERGVDLAEAFELLRSRARSQRLSLGAVAGDVVRSRGLGELV